MGDFTFHMDSPGDNEQPLGSFSEFDSDFGAQFATTAHDNGMLSSTPLETQYENFPDFDDQLYGGSHEVLPVTDDPSSPQLDVDPASLSYNTFNSNLNAEPWNFGMPRALPTMIPTSIPSIQIPHNPHSNINHDPFALSRSFGGLSHDSGYGTRPHMDTVSLFSAPAGRVQFADDVSEVNEGPSHTKGNGKKPFVCTLGEDHEHKTREFANIHDLERHQRSKHGVKPAHSQAHYYRCMIRNCRNKDKLWDRKDNFRSHLQRKHFHNMNDERTHNHINDLVARSQRILSDDQMTEVHRRKQENKMRSRETADRRAQRRLSRANSTATSASGARRKRGGSTTSVTLSRANSTAGDTPVLAEADANYVLDRVDTKSSYVSKHNAGAMLELNTNVDNLTITSPTLDITPRSRSASLQVPLSPHVRPQNHWNVTSAPRSSPNDHTQYDFM